MKQIVKPRDLSGDQIEAWQDEQIELAAQRWIADGDAPLPREFKKMSDLTDFLASVRLREVFKSERKRVDKQRRVDAVIAAIVSERRRVSLAGPTAFLFRNRRLSVGAARGRARPPLDPAPPRGRRHRRRTGRRARGDGLGLARPLQKFG